MSLASTPSELPLTGRRIVLGITGSIAAYKSAVLARELRRRGAEVRVVMTPGATEFITPLTLATLVDHPVHSDFTEDEHAGVWTNHVELGIWGDLILVAPATANTLAAMVHGGCDNLLQAVLLSARCPVAVAPAMDLDMFTHEATQTNLQTLADRGVRVIEPGTGLLASGLHGKGRMAEPEEIADEVAAHFASDLPWAGKNVLITAGPTHEPMDAVRFLGNRSSGKMGFALAEVLANAGAQVTLVAGPVHLPTPDRVHARIDVQTAVEMNDAVQQRWTDMDWGIACAAVSDFRPAQTSTEKWHRGDMPQAIELVENPDILAGMGNRKSSHQTLVGFALESDDGLASAQGKMTRKNLDAIVLNSLKDDGAGFGHDTNKVSVHFRDGKSVSFELKSKYEVAQDLVELWEDNPEHMIPLVKTPHFIFTRSSFTRLCMVVLLGASMFVDMSAQELNCNVTVIAPQISNVDASRFEALEDGIREFMNGRRWTEDNFEFEERIECTLQLTISEAIGSTVFKGSMQVQSSRPVFNSDYNTAVLLVNDGDIQFEWLDNSNILFNPGQHRDNLSSLLAYYAYMILGMDYDTFSLEGGTPHFLQAQAIVANAQNAGERGWKASQGKQNRYWLIENHLSQTFRPVRTCLYNYHRKGLDVLFDDVEGARLTMAEALIDMRSTNRIRPGSFNIQVFFLAKSDEIINVFGPAPDAEKARLIPILKQLDPGNIQAYDQRLG